MASQESDGAAVTDITFMATVARVQTMADGGLRVILDFSEDCVMQAAQLMECKRFETVLNITASPLINNGDSTRAIREGKVRKSGWKTTERAPIDGAA